MCWGPITLDEFEWQNAEFVRRNYEFDPTFLTRLATQTNFSDNLWIWMLTFKVDWQNSNVNDNLTKLNFRFECSKLLRTKLNWKLMKLNADVTEMGGKTYIKEELRNRFNLSLEERATFFKHNSENLMKIGWKIRKLWHFEVSQVFPKHF